MLIDSKQETNRLKLPFSPSAARLKLEIGKLGIRQEKSPVSTPISSYCFRISERKITVKKKTRLNRQEFQTQKQNTRRKTLSFSMGLHGIYISPISYHLLRFPLVFFLFFVFLFQLRTSSRDSELSSSVLIPTPVISVSGLPHFTFRFPSTCTCTHTHCSHHRHATLIVL